METLQKAMEILDGKLQKHKDGLVQMTTEEVKKISDQLTEFKTVEFKSLKDELVAKDATILEIQNEVKELKAKRARFGAGGGQQGEVMQRPSIMAEISKTIFEKKEAFEAAERTGKVDGLQVEIKAPGVVLSTSLANGSYIDYLDWRPGMEPTGQFRIRELVRTVASAFDTVYFPRANTPVGQGSFGRQTPEGSTKAQVDRGYTMQTLNLMPIAAFIQVSRQSLRNIPFLQTWLPTSLNEQLLDAEDTDFASQIISAATASSVTQTPGGTNVTVAAERMIYFIKNLRITKNVPTGIACDPGVWAEILTTKPQNYSVPLGYNVDINGNVRLLGVDVFPANWLTGGRVIVADWRKAAIVESEGLTFRQSDNVASTFIQNELTFLLERTNGIAIFRPDAFLTTTVS